MNCSRIQCMIFYYISLRPFFLWMLIHLSHRFNNIAAVYKRGLDAQILRQIKRSKCVIVMRLARLKCRNTALAENLFQLWDELLGSFSKIVLNDFVTFFPRTRHYWLKMLNYLMHRITEATYFIYYGSHFLAELEEEGKLTWFKLGLVKSILYIFSRAFYTYFPERFIHIFQSGLKYSINYVKLLRW